MFQIAFSGKPEERREEGGEDCYPVGEVDDVQEGLH